MWSTYCDNIVAKNAKAADGDVITKKNPKLKVATDNTVNKLSSHMIKISKKKIRFRSSENFSLVLDSVAVRNVIKAVVLCILYCTYFHLPLP